MGLDLALAQGTRVDDTGASAPEVKRQRARVEAYQARQQVDSDAEGAGGHEYTNPLPMCRCSSTHNHVNPNVGPTYFGHYFTRPYAHKITRNINHLRSGINELNAETCKL